MTTLSFPFQAPATNGELIDVVPGQIKWLRMPLPLALNHINLYLVRDGAGWRIVDTGINTQETRDIWERILPALDGPVTGIICTHHHGDHCGLAGWFTEKLRVPLYMSRAEYFAMRIFDGGFSGESWEFREFFIRAGLPGEQLLNLIDALNRFGQAFTESPMPRAYQRLRDGGTLTIGDHVWQVWGGEGHSPEHASLYCPDLGVLLSGDQLLARISPNVGVLPFEPEASPLEDWFVSLEHIGRLPEETLVLPAHELPFHGLKARAEELRQHHQGVLDKMQTLCAEQPDTAYGLANRFFTHRSGPMDSILAIAETLAHLAYLCGQGRLQRELQQDGSYQYRVQAS
ncbi:MBL fold metallo-hydrolase [Denitratisoma oestradiolicum]|uniref:Metallo-beta-lactamase domain-containing protein n=1 Tax=Denitratisoma oestradiolicum TaxID=311182 RepID=A0A6S6XXZ3_9PROT|nr:MBL fold metallo-hydrolase [Denitratisoma oestradiolicum]TWO82263.1 hypothetical protein CBW56_02135 [Denitratisoma oestradiolicum]CAB1369215.1 conserved protein of unknown function [Denitratisoma oestradiolicum]